MSDNAQGLAMVMPWIFNLEGGSSGQSGVPPNFMECVVSTARKRGQCWATNRMTISLSLGSSILFLFGYDELGGHRWGKPDERRWLIRKTSLSKVAR